MENKTKNVIYCFLLALSLFVITSGCSGLGYAAKNPFAYDDTDSGEPDSASYTVYAKEELKATPQVFINIPLARQSRDYTCGVACVQAILRYAGYDFDTKEDTLADVLKANEEYGTTIASIISFLNQVSYSGGNEPPFHAALQMHMSIDDIIAALDQGKPVICLIQAWASDEQGGFDLLRDYSGDWSSGHYVIAVGYDEQRIYFMDPSTMGNYTYIAKDELEARWHDVDGESSKIERTGIIVQVNNPSYNPELFYKIL